MHSCALSTLHLWSAQSISKERKYFCAKEHYVQICMPPAADSAQKSPSEHETKPCVIQQTQFHMDGMHLICSPGLRDASFVVRKKTHLRLMDAIWEIPQDLVWKHLPIGRKSWSFNNRTYFLGGAGREGIRYTLWSLNSSALLILTSLSRLSPMW